MRECRRLLPEPGRLPMRRYLVTVVWRGFRWSLTGLAKHPCDLVVSLAGEFGPGAAIKVGPA